MEKFARTELPNLRRPLVLLPTVDLTPDDLPRVLDDSGVRVIVTSRDSRQWLPPVLTVEIGRFTPDQSVDYLTRSVTGLSAEDATYLAARLGHLPLALCYAALWLHRGCAVRTFVNLIEQHPDLAFGDVGPDDYPSTLIAEMQLVVDALPASTTPTTRDALGALAIVKGGPLPIPNPSGHIHRSLWRPASTELSAPSPYRFHKALQPAESVGLVQRYADRVTMDLLKADLMRGLLSVSERSRAAGLAGSALLNRVPANEGTAEWIDWPCWAECVDALMAIDPADMTSREGRFSLLGAADFALAQGRYQEAHARLLTLRRAWWPPGSGYLAVPIEVRLRTLDLLSLAAARLGNGQAWRYATAAFRYRLPRQGEFHADTIASALSMAVVTRNLCRLTTLRDAAEAGRHDRLALRIDSLKAEIQLQSYHNAELVTELMQIVDAQSRVLGAGHPETLFSQHSLARAYAENGQAQRALDQYESVVSGRSATLGEHHPDTRFSIAALDAHRKEMLPT
ncbi:tetratricopeptide repeat protein [Kitasatospora sp. NPDC004614]|uniref:tetratricopeptide repeat protein n=1 Tax=unclassified Kitasatospora TaxID=2633591 RepID=UPI0036AEDCB9